MKTQALLLLIPFSVFLTETVSFIPAMQESCAIVAVKKNSCTQTKEQGQCHKKPWRYSCSKMTKHKDCSDKKGNNKKPCGKKCTDNPDCSTCPVCYSFIFQPQYQWQAQPFIFKNHYSLPVTGNTSSYTPDVWKPPNGFLYSS